MNLSSLHLLRLFQSLFVLVIVAGIGYAMQSIEQKIERLRVRETNHIQNGANALSKQVEFINHDLTFLARHSTTRSAIQQPSPSNLTHLADDFAAFSASHCITTKFVG